MSPGQTHQMCLRFYGHRTWHGTWTAVCVDLDLAVERSTRQEAIEAMYQQVFGYIKVVLNTEDKDSLKYLLHRPAPLRDRMVFRLIYMLCWPRIIGKWLLGFVDSFVECFPLSEYTYAV